MTAKSKLLVFFFIVIIISKAIPARARILEFDDYLVDVPGSWTVRQDGELVTLISPGREAVFL